MQTSQAQCSHNGPVSLGAPAVDSSCPQMERFFRMTSAGWSFCNWWLFIIYITLSLKQNTWTLIFSKEVCVQRACQYSIFSKKPLRSQTHFLHPPFFRPLPPPPLPPHVSFTDFLKRRLERLRSLHRVLCFSIIKSVYFHSQGNTPRTRKTLPPPPPRGLPGLLCCPHHLLSGAASAPS